MPLLAPPPPHTCTCRVSAGRVKRACDVLRRIREALQAADECGDNDSFDRLTREHAAHLREVRG